jgi:hypothetical protein
MKIAMLIVRLKMGNQLGVFLKVKIKSAKFKWMEKIKKVIAKNEI